MGCASSKRVEAAVDVYKPAPASFAVFNINSIQEPWLMVNNTAEEHDEKPTHVPDPILNTIEATDAPQSWAEVSKALEDLKPTLAAATKPVVAMSPEPPASLSPPEAQDSPAQTKKIPRKSFSFHTLEELESKITPKPKPKPKPKSNESEPNELRRTASRRDEMKKTETKGNESRVEEGHNYKPVKQNIFIMKDKLEKEKEGKQSNFEKLISLKRNPLSEYPEKCPPGGGDTVVVYTTSLGGVRRTFEDCNRVRDLLEGLRVLFDERNVSLHGEFLKELKELLGEGAKVPRVFVKGRYLGGVEEVVELNESGRLGRILNAARVERGVGRQVCEGCGGVRFVPCLECGGSCKVVLSGGDKKERCPKCNENGLVHCPVCICV